MSDQTKLAIDRNRGERAAKLLEDELLIEAYAKIEADLIKAWIGSDPRDTEGRERVWAAIHANRKHQTFLLSVIDNGRLAAKELLSIAEDEERNNRTAA